MKAKIINEKGSYARFYQTDGIRLLGWSSPFQVPINSSFRLDLCRIKILEIKEQMSSGIEIIKVLSNVLN